MLSAFNNLTEEVRGLRQDVKSVDKNLGKGFKTTSNQLTKGFNGTKTALEKGFKETKKQLEKQEREALSRESIRHAELVEHAKHNVDFLSRLAQNGFAGFQTPNQAGTSSLNPTPTQNRQRGLPDTRQLPPKSCALNELVCYCAQFFFPELQSKDRLSYTNTRTSPVYQLFESFREPNGKRQVPAARYCKFAEMMRDQIVLGSVQATPKGGNRLNFGMRRNRAQRREAAGPYPRPRR